MNQNPFLQYKTLILRGDYGAAAILQRFVLSMWNGSAYPANMSNLRQLDDVHFSIAIQMIEHYKRYGEGCDEFMNLADLIRQQLPEEE